MLSPVIPLAHPRSNGEEALPATYPGFPSPGTTIHKVLA